MNAKRPIRILSSDILIADIVTHLDGNEQLQRMMGQLNLKKGGKAAITKEQFDQMAPAIMEQPHQIFPGGSSANVLTTLSKLAGDDVKIDFVGRVGHGPISTTISKAMEDAGIHRIKPRRSDGLSPQAATSYVIKYPDGERSVATYPGNAREFVSPDLVTPELVENSDAILVQGSLWEKFDPEFSNKLLEERWEQKKELWLALPTRAKFGVENAGLFRYIIPSSNVVLANMEELARVAGLVDEHATDKDITPEMKTEALHRLQQAFLKDFPNKERIPNLRRQVAFITDGELGSYIVTRDHISKIESVPPKEVKNKTGAGDTAFAGFLFGYMHGLRHEDSAKIANTLASRKIELDTTRLPDPKAVLEQDMPCMARMIQEGKTGMSAAL